MRQDHFNIAGKRFGNPECIFHEQSHLAVEKEHTSRGNDQWDDHRRNQNCHDSATEGNVTLA